MTTRPDVIVVGAGVAGLAAATALAHAGARVLVVEARGEPGGRTSSFRDRASGAQVDNGQHVVLGCYRETFAYLERVGAAADIALQSGLEVPTIDRDGVMSYLRCPPWSPPWNLLAGLVSWSAIGWRDRWSARHVLTPLRAAQRRGEASREPEPHETVAVWLTRHRQTARMCEVLWEPLALAALNQSTETAAAGTFVEVLSRVLGPGRHDAAIGLPTRPLGHTFGSAASGYLAARGSRVWCHAPARLVLDGGRVAGVDVRNERVLAPVVVAALPWHGWRTFLSKDDASRAGLASVRAAAVSRASSPIVTVNVWTDRPVLHTAFVGLPGRAFHWVFAHAGDAGGPQAHRVSLVASGAEEMAAATARDVVGRAIADLRGALPAAAAASILRTTVFREPRATFSLTPGQPPRPRAETPVNGLILAGDWTDTRLPATIEGAAQSGHVAAALVLGRTQPGQLERSKAS